MHANERSGAGSRDRRLRVLPRLRACHLARDPAPRRSHIVRVADCVPYHTDHDHRGRALCNYRRARLDGGRRHGRVHVSRRRAAHHPGSLSYVHGEGTACGLTRACLAWRPAGYRACCRRDGPCGQRHRQYPGHARHVTPARPRLAPRVRSVHTEPAHVGPSGADLEAHIHPRAARPGTR